MRERLIELIESARYWGIGTSAEIADRLLAEGVIVPPCKVGQTVYYIGGFYGYEKIHAKKVKSIWFDNEGMIVTVSGMYMDFNIPENELYFTREEAEKALEKMKGGAE